MKMATLGAATFDVFLTGEALRAKRDVRTYDYVERFPLGAKLELDDVVYSTGGGATNAAVTFARQGFDTTFLGKIGDDLPGREVLKDLHNEGVRTDKVTIDLEGGTGYSTLLVAPRGERTVLVYRGVSEELETEDFKASSLNVQWLYISSLAGNLRLLSRVITDFKRKNTKIAYNPGAGELKKADQLKRLLPKIDVLMTNKDEIKRLVSADDEKRLLRSAAKLSGVVVVTDGPKGSWTTDGKKLYRAGLYKDIKVADRTGAGDAFCSGFVAALAKGKQIPDALAFGSANSTSVVRYIGAKTGILDKHAKIKPMKIEEAAL